MLINRYRVDDKVNVDDYCHDDDDDDVHDDLLLIMISMMSIIIGNYEGMGELRKEELFKSALLYNIIRDNIYIIDHVKLQDSMNNIYIH